MFDASNLLCLFESLFSSSKLHFSNISVFDCSRVDGRYFFRVLPRLVSVPPPGMAPCAIGSIVEVLVSATGMYTTLIQFDDITLPLAHACRKHSLQSIDL